jgi:hypothetical protein
MTTIDERYRRADYRPDEPSAAYSPAAVINGTVPAGGHDLPGGPGRVLVETLHNTGGMVHRALIGGTWAPGPAGGLAFVVGLTGPIASGAPAAVPSVLGQPLVVGLPDEFGQPVLTGLSRAAGQLPPGTFTVDRAAYHEAWSSAQAFQRAAGLLVDVLVALCRGQDPEPAVRAALRSW